MPRQSDLATIALIVFGAAYPAIVFLFRGMLAPSVFIVLALLTIGSRLALGKPHDDGWRPALALSAVGLALLAVVDATLAVRAYPVLISLAAAAVFGVTLWRQPSLVERLALASGERWSTSLQGYCRNVTLLWTTWLVVNAAIAAYFALSGDDETWAIWTGLLSYLVSGMLFAGEWLVRSVAVRRGP